MSLASATMPPIDRSARLRARRTARRRKGLASTMAYLAIAVAVVWCVFPFYWMVATSVRPAAEIYARPPELVPGGITLEHYWTLLVGERFWLYALNTLGVALAVTAISVAVSIMCGYAVARYRFRGAAALPLLALYGQMFPPVLLLIPFYTQLRAFGLLDSLGGLVIVYLSYILPLSIWMMRGFFAQIPASLEEAARVDGCSRWTALWRVVVPIARPGIAAVATWALIQSWNEFLYASTFIIDQDKRTLSLGLSSLIGENTTDWGVLMAGGVLTALPIMAIFFLAQRHLVSGLGGGAVKG